MVVFGHLGSLQRVLPFRTPLHVLLGKVFGTLALTYVALNIVVHLIWAFYVVKKGHECGYVNLSVEVLEGLRAPRLELVDRLLLFTEYGSYFSIFFGLFCLGILFLFPLLASARAANRRSVKTWNWIVASVLQKPSDPPTEEEPFHTCCCCCSLACLDCLV